MKEIAINNTPALRKGIVPEIPVLFCPVVIAVGRGILKT